MNHSKRKEQFNQGIDVDIKGMTTHLESQIKHLEYKNEFLESENQKLQIKIKWYEEQTKLALKNKYGSSSEQTNQLSLDLFNEAESLQMSKLTEPDIEIITYERKKRAKQARLDISELPVETIEYQLDDTNCPSCASNMHVMTKEIRKELKIIPAQLSVIEHVSYVYACRHCENHDIKTPIIKAKAPNAVIPKSLVSPSLLSYIMHRKYSEAIPLYRQEQQFNQLGIAFLRQNLANWVIKGSKWLEYLYNHMHGYLIKEDILHADETPLQVLNEKHKNAQSKSYMWVYLTGNSSFPVVLYDYQDSRAHKHPKQFLKGFNGYLHADGYQAYTKLEGVKVVACMAHSRRNFHEAILVAPKNGGPSYLAAHKGFEYYDKLFRIEREIKAKTYDEKVELRNKFSKPLLDEFKNWLDEQSKIVIPKSKLGEAIKYSINQWQNMLRYLEDGRLELSNNRAERAVKPFVIGRNYVSKLIMC